MLGQPRPNVEEIKKRMFEEAKEDNPYLMGSQPSNGGLQARVIQTSQASIVQGKF